MITKEVNREGRSEGAIGGVQPEVGSIKVIEKVVILTKKELRVRMRKQHIVSVTPAPVVMGA